MRQIIAALLVTFWCSPSAVADETSMTFKGAANGGNCNECVWLAAEGRITETTADDFRQAVGSRRNVLVRFNSPGGIAIGGIKLGYALREANASVVVGSTQFRKVDGYTQDEEGPGVCVSACALAFMGGQYRNANENELGVHRVFLNVPDKPFTTDADGMLREGQMISALIVGYMLEMGIKTDIFSAIAQTDRNSIRFLTIPEMIEWGVLNKSWRPSGWSIDLTRINPVAYTLSEFGSQHSARLEYSCNNQSQRLSLSLRLPESYIQDDSTREDGGAINLLTEHAELEFLKDGIPVQNSKPNLLKRHADDQFLYGTIEDNGIIESTLIADVVAMSLYSSFWATRQYDDFEMMTPTFSLQHSARAIRLIKKNC